MADIAIGEAITEGFVLIRRRPLAILMWGVVQLAMTAVTVAVLWPVYAAMIGQITEAARSGAAPNPQAIEAASTPLQAISWLLNLVAVAVNAVCSCAVIRAILRPEESRWGYLRLGSAELFTFLLGIVAVLAVFLAVIVLMIPVIVVVSIMAAVNAGAAGALVGALAVVAGGVALVYAALRFVFAGPMIVDDGKFHLMESWTATRGHVGQLFMVGLGAGVLLLLVEVLFFVLLSALGMAGVGALAGGLDKVEALFSQPPGVIAGRLAPILIFLTVLWTPFAGAVLAIWGAPWARAYRDLVRSDAATTFA